MKARISPEVGAHVHPDGKVDLARVAKFSASSVETQLLVRAELRGRIADDSTTLEIALVSFLLAFVGLMIAPARPIELHGAPWWFSLITGVLIGLIAMIILLPFVVRAGRQHGRRTRATVWLAAFDDVHLTARLVAVPAGDSPKLDSGRVKRPALRKGRPPAGLSRRSWSA